MRLACFALYTIKDNDYTYKHVIVNTARIILPGNSSNMTHTNVIYIYVQIHDKLSLEILKNTAVLLKTSVAQSAEIFVSVDPLCNKTAEMEIVRKSQYLSQKAKLGKYLQN